MVKPTAAAGNEPRGTSERKHVTADNMMDAADQIREGAAKRNRTAATTGCRLLSCPTLQVSCNKQQDQTGNTSPQENLPSR